MKYISIDGDDVGRKITSFFLSNSSEQLSTLSLDLQLSTTKIATLLREKKFTILFCAADGVVAFVDYEINFDYLFEAINKLAPEEITFSAGVGNSLREAYIALISAKSNGKNCLHFYTNLN